MTKLFSTFVSSVLIVPFLFSCHRPDNTVKVNDDTLYDRFINEKVEVSPLTHTKAAYGYTKNKTQGHQNWYYGYFNDGRFNLMTYDEKEAAFIMDTKRIKNDMITGQDVGLRWQATRAMDTYIDGKFIAYGDTTLKIAHNGQVVFEKFVKSGKTAYIYQPLSVFINSNIDFIINGKASFNPTIQFDDFIDETLHYEAGEDTDHAYVGDVHPLYVDGQLRNYYLSTNGRFTADMAISDDLVVFRDTETKASPTNPPLTEGFATRVFQHENKYYSYYGAYSRIEYTMSDDGYVFENGVRLDAEVNILGQTTIDERYIWGRDPYTFFDPDINRYRIVMMHYLKDRTPTSLPNIDLVLYTSVDTHPHQFISTASPLINFGITNNEPEVPMMLKIGRRWYLFASLSGRSSNFVGPMSYWIGDIDTKITDVKWNEKTEHILTGEDLCAPQIVEVMGRYYIYGWLTSGAYGGTWGGTINLPAQVYQNDDGTLSVKIDDHLQKKLSRGEVNSLDDNTFTMTGQFTINDGRLITTRLDNNFATLTFDTTLNRTITFANISNIKQNAVVGIELSNDDGDTYQIRYSEKANNIQIYKKGVGRTLGVYELSGSKLSKVEFVIVAEGSLLEVFVNNKYAVYARLDKQLTNFKTGFYTNAIDISLDAFSVNQLARKNNFQDN